MAGNGRLTNNIYAVVRRAFARFDEIFSSRCRGTAAPRDYNTWNIQLNSEMTHAVAAIDPYGAAGATRNGPVPAPGRQRGGFPPYGKIRTADAPPDIFP